jgi:parvulin-like peptidyl-prolyl isomerase
MFASVGDSQISETEFNNAFSRHMRSKFYHGKPPEAQVDLVRQQVAESIITRSLLVAESRRQGLKCDEQAVLETIQQYDKRYASSEQWQQNRESLLGKLKERLCEDDLIRQIESKVRKVSRPTEKELSEYYESNLDKFTEPARQRVSVILLQVDPSAPKSVWDAATTEAKSIKAEIEQGGDFSEIASLRSADKSAQNGGDMGYLHKGMLSPAAEKVVDELSLKQISEPVRLLRGIAIFRVDERLPARVRAHSEVSLRVKDLWEREQGENNWTSFKDKLWATTPIKIYDPSVSLKELN